MTTRSGDGERGEARAFALVLLIVCLLLLQGVVWVARSGAHAATRDAVALDRPVASPVPTLAPTTTVVQTPALHPVDPPADPYQAEPLVQIGTIEIPKIGLVHPVFEGITLGTIDHGPGHWPGTALPGQPGNAVFAGHRVTHTHPFLHIDQLAPGDLVIFTIRGQRSTYRVTGSQVVRPDETWIVNQTATATATLFACHPPHSATYRYVVHLELVATG